MRRHLGERATVLGAVVLAAMVLVGSETAVGQEKKRISSWSAKAENTKFTFRHTLDIPDLPYHRIAMNEFRRMWPDGGGPVVEGRKVVEEIGREMAEGIGGNGGSHGWASGALRTGIRRSPSIAAPTSRSPLLLES